MSTASPHLPGFRCPPENHCSARSRRRQLGFRSTFASTTEDRETLHTGGPDVLDELDPHPLDLAFARDCSCIGARDCEDAGAEPGVSCTPICLRPPGRPFPSSLAETTRSPLRVLLMNVTEAAEESTL
jgi:hypothetical protein